MFRLLILLCVFATAFGALPKGWKACSMKEKDYNECLAKALIDAVKSLHHGDRKLGVLPLDPLVITKLTINNGGGPVAINLTLSDLKVIGITTAVIKKVKNDWEKMNIEIFIKDLPILSDYKMNGNIMMMPIMGEGIANMTYDNLTIMADVEWGLEEKDNVKYLNIKKLSVDLFADRLYLLFENLFNGNKDLSDNMNMVMNDNWKVILDELRPSISISLSEVFKTIANVILKKIPFSEINI